MAKAQQVFPWAEQLRVPEVPVRPESTAGSTAQSLPPTSAANANASAQQGIGQFAEVALGPPVPVPLSEAVAAGVFGLDVTGAIALDAEQVAALVSEHANELIGLIGEAEALREAIRTGTDPRTGRAYRDSDATSKAAERNTAELHRVESTYTDALAAFEEGFGAEATRQLDEWVRAEIAGGTHRMGGYDPGHPWHYYVAGDNAPPIPFDQISPCEEAGRWLERDLPKHPAKRVAKMRETLNREEQQLAADRERYEDVIAHGAEALSRYDREIAYGGNDELARASTLALKYNHIRLGLGRIDWLRQRVGSQQEFGR